MKLSISGVEISWNKDDINQLTTNLLNIKNSLASNLDEKTKKETQNTIKCIEWIVEEINSIDNNQLDPKILKKAVGNILENLDYNAILMTILIKYAEVLRSKE